MSQAGKEDLLCELSVLDQTRHVEETSFVQNAWKHGQHLELHSWVYRLSDGLLQDLRFVPSSKRPQSFSPRLGEDQKVSHRLITDELHGMGRLNCNTMVL